MKCNGMKVVWCAVLAGGLGFLSVQAENVNEQKSDVRGSHCVSEKCAKLVSPEKENARKAARERFAADAAVFDRATRREIERLYRKVSSRSNEAKRLFDEIRTDYPNAVTHRGGPFAAWLPK